MPSHVPDLSRRGCLAGIAGLGVWTASGCIGARATAGTPDSRATASPHEPMTTASAGQTVFLGRFRFVLPAGWVVAGREQKTYFSRVSDDLSPSGPSVPGMSETLRILRGGIPPNDPLLREFTLDGVGPAAWFALGDAQSPNRRLVVLAGSPEGGVRIDTLASVGRELQAEQALRQLAAGYRAGVRTGFCLPHGAITLDPSRSESADLVATSLHTPNAELKFSSLVVAKPRSDGPLADPAADARALRGSGATLKLLSSHKRQVAGFSSYDKRVEFQEAGKPPVLMYNFFFAGAAASSVAPEIIIALDGPTAAKAMLDAAWNQFLDSVQPIPLR